MSEKYPAYSIQQTYIIKAVSKSEKRILTCDERIDIPTIEPLSNVKPIPYGAEFDITVIPCIELTGESLSEFNLTFETNEGVTVLPIEIQSGTREPLENPYITSRYVLVLPRGATGVKSCKLTLKDTGEEIQHNFTFGIMHPPYNYDNALFGYLSNGVDKNRKAISELNNKVNNLKLKIKPKYTATLQVPKNAGKQTIDIEDWQLFFDTKFSYRSSPEPTIHKPTITIQGSFGQNVYTLSLNKPENYVSIDLFTCMLTVYDYSTGEIMEQFKIYRRDDGFKSLSFENFDDIRESGLYITAAGARVNA